MTIIREIGMKIIHEASNLPSNYKAIISNLVTSETNAETMIKNKMIDNVFHAMSNNFSVPPLQQIIVLYLTKIAKNKISYDAAGEICRKISAKQYRDMYNLLYEAWIDKHYH